MRDQVHISFWFLKKPSGYILPCGKVRTPHILFIYFYKWTYSHLIIWISYEQNLIEYTHCNISVFFSRPCLGPVASLSLKETLVKQKIPPQLSCFSGVLFMIFFLIITHWLVTLCGALNLLYLLISILLPC